MAIMMNNDIEWKMVKLGDLCNIRMGQSPEGKFYNDKQIGLPLVQGNADIEDRKTIIRSYTSYITKTCDKGDYILSVRAPVGAVAKATFNACIGRGVCAFSYPNEYLYQYFIFVENQWGKFSTGSTFDSINGPTLKQVKIPIPYKNGAPDLETQKEIAQKLGDMDSLIAAKGKLLAKKRNLKTAAMQKLLPRDTTEVKLKDCVNFVNGIAHENFVSELGEYILVNSKFISTEGRVVKYSSKQLLPIEEHSILMVMSDVPNGKAIGKCFYVPNSKFKGTLNQRICMLKVKDRIDSEFLFRLLNRNKYFLAFDDGVKQTNLRKSDVLGCPIPLPEYTEQCRIASILSDMDSELAAIEKEITKLQNLKTAMMQKMFCFGDSDSSSE